MYCADKRRIQLDALMRETVPAKWQDGLKKAFLFEFFDKWLDFLSKSERSIADFFQIFGVLYIQNTPKKIYKIAKRYIKIMRFR